MNPILKKDKGSSILNLNDDEMSNNGKRYS